MLNVLAECRSVKSAKVSHAKNVRICEAGIREIELALQSFTKRDLNREIRILADIPDVNQPGKKP